MSQHETAQDLFQAELDNVNDQIDKLERYKKAIVEAIQVRSDMQFLILHPDLPMGPILLPERSHTAAMLTDGKVARDARPNTISMAKRVLQNLGGEEKKPDEIRALIRKTYGVDAAKSLEQMLYKRAAAHQVFYKTPDGRFGLLAIKDSKEA